MVINKRIIFRIFYGKSPQRYRLDFVQDNPDSPKCEIFKIADGTSFYNTTIVGEDPVELVFQALKHLENKIGLADIEIN